MNAAEILTYINKMQWVTIGRLCEEFHISESTARRMLALLSKEGAVERFRGGAIAKNSMEANTDIGRRSNIRKPQKSKIAKLASGIIKEGSTVILMGGSTVCEICRYIENRMLTVITNSFLVLKALQYSPTIRLIFLGGLFNLQEYEVGGVLANQGLKFIRADYLFMGAAAFDEKHGFITANPAIELYLSCLEISTTACVLADSSKYMSGGVSVTARPNQIHYLFTDADLPQHAIDEFRALGVDVVLAPSGE